MILEVLFIFIISISALLMSIARNPIYSALYMILLFVNVSGLLFVLKAEFLAIILLLVYVGAISVMFLCIVMFLNINIADTASELHLIVADKILSFLFKANLSMSQVKSFQRFVFFLVISFELISFSIWCFGFFWLFSSSFSRREFLRSRKDTARLLAEVMYADLKIQFVLAGLILLVSMIAVIAMSLKKTLVLGYQDTQRQGRRSALVSVKSF